MAKKKSAPLEIYEPNLKQRGIEMRKRAIELMHIHSNPLEAARAGDRRGLARMYELAAGWTRLCEWGPREQTEWIAQRLESIAQTLWKSIRAGADPRDFENDIARASGVIRSKRGRPKGSKTRRPRKLS